MRNIDSSPKRATDRLSARGEPRPFRATLANPSGTGVEVGSESTGRTASAL
ncbi:hypothetical protein B005_2572 [Nocardiopsis alba ATCC BAA-2165]|uniref:Uncharacterized protein n=1 Tax=Nocardiopsis alba (strain ATCC BAA-2165 / BE74) TaxID=1205910 RepID=J7L2S4_NOCAA|nr:hypothetical protein B005_2572 [Nocardiopsis alba ATCC BAA-2165]